MKRALMIVAAFFALGIILSLSGESSGPSAGMFAGLLGMSQLVDNPPKNGLCRRLVATRWRQIGSAGVLILVGALILHATSRDPKTFEWQIEAIRFVAFLALGAAISLFVFKEPRDSYSEWARRARQGSLEDQP